MRAAPASADGTKQANRLPEECKRAIAILDFADSFVRGNPPQDAVGIGVSADLVALTTGAAHEIGKRLGLAADHEERRVDAVRSQAIQHARRDRRVRTVVKG